MFLLLSTLASGLHCLCLVLTISTHSCAGNSFSRGQSRLWSLSAVHKDAQDSGHLQGSFPVVGFCLCFHEGNLTEGCPRSSQSQNNCFCIFLLMPRKAQSTLLPRRDRAECNSPTMASILAPGSTSTYFSRWQTIKAKHVRYSSYPIGLQM